MGAAGFSLLRPKVMPVMANTPTAIRTPVRIRLLSLDLGVRLISMEILVCNASMARTR